VIGDSARIFSPSSQLYYSTRLVNSAALGKGRLTTIQSGTSVRMMKILRTELSTVSQPQIHCRVVQKQARKQFGI